MDQIDRQRVLLEVIGLVKPGNVLKVHYTNLGFGNESKPYHFSVVVTRMNSSLEAVILVPVSTKLYSHKFFVPLNLSMHSDLQPVDDELLDMEAFALVSKAKQVAIGSLFEKPVAHLRGTLFSMKRDEIMRERRKYLKQQFKNKNKGNKK